MSTPTDRLAHALKWAQDNPPRKDRLSPELRAKTRARMNAYIAKRKARDPNFRLALSLRCRIGNAMRAFGFRKHKGTLDLVGCTIPQLRAHLQSLWLPGMCWENYGQWHIDHKRPIASFDLTHAAQQYACFHFSNLQPLWSVDNYRKGDTWAAWINPSQSRMMP